MGINQTSKLPQNEFIHITINSGMFGVLSLLS